MDAYQKHLKNQRRLWSLTAKQGNSVIEATGWRRSGDRSFFTQEEMDEFSDNVLKKLTPYLNQGASVLEIGVGSGQILQKVAPYVQAYAGADLSADILEKCKSFSLSVESHLVFYELAAHEINRIDNQFDVIIMNSVMQYFPDQAYTKEVLRLCRDKLKDGGVIFCGDLMDLTKKEALIQYVCKENEAAKTNYDKLLFYDPCFFEDTVKSLGIAGCECSGKIYTIPNELSLFRFDAMLHL